jgi:hypothetical protein
MGRRFAYRSARTDLAVVAAQYHEVQVNDQGQRVEETGL